MWWWELHQVLLTVLVGRFIRMYYYTDIVVTCIIAPLLEVNSVIASFVDRGTRGPVWHISLYFSGFQLDAMAALWYAGVPAILRLHQMISVSAPHPPVYG